MATLRLEEISKAIQHSVTEKRTRTNGGPSPTVSGVAYRHFRQKAFRLLSHYVDNNFDDSFYWLLAMRNQLPKRTRGSVAGNPFHLGLLAMTAAAGEFMSRNKLRDLAAEMQCGHALGILPAEFNAYVSGARRRATEQRIRDAMARSNLP